MVKDISTLSDIDLVRNVKEDSCSDSFKELASRHSKLFYKICQKYLKTLLVFGYSAADIFDEKDAVLFESILKYESDRGAVFSTWFGIYTRFFCLNKINKAKKIPEFGSEAEILKSFNDRAMEDYQLEPAASIDMDAVFKVLDNVGDKRLPNIFRLRYDTQSAKKKTWAQVAKTLKLTIPRAIQLHNKGLKLIREEISNNKLEIYQET